MNEENEIHLDFFKEFGANIRTDLICKSLPIESLKEFKKNPKNFLGNFSPEFVREFGKPIDGQAIEDISKEMVLKADKERRQIKKRMEQEL